jgi:ABC-type microcin C transport system permease subunit YejB
MPNSTATEMLEFAIISFTFVILLAIYFSNGSYIPVIEISDTFFSIMNDFLNSLKSNTFF